MQGCGAQGRAASTCAQLQTTCESHAALPSRLSRSTASHVRTDVPISGPRAMIQSAICGLLWYGSKTLINELAHSCATESTSTIVLRLSLCRTSCATSAQRLRRRPSTAWSNNSFWCASCRLCARTSGLLVPASASTPAPAGGSSGSGACFSAGACAAIAAERVPAPARSSAVPSAADAESTRR